MRVAYNINDRWAVAAEEYAGFGPLHRFVPVNQQFQEVWAVMDRSRQDSQYRSRGGPGLHRRSRPADIQADAVARSQLTKVNLLGQAGVNFREKRSPRFGWLLKFAYGSCPAVIPVNKFQ